MIKLNHIPALVMLLACCAGANAQQISKEELIFLTQEWKGERFPDGRPKVPDNIIRRMKSVSVEEAWATMSNAGYKYQIAEGWEVINPDSVLVGRAFTATFMPGRPDVWKAIDSLGKKQEEEHRTFGPWRCLGKAMYMWPISSVQKEMGRQSVTT